MKNKEVIKLLKITAAAFSATFMLTACDLNVQVSPEVDPIVVTDNGTEGKEETPDKEETPEKEETPDNTEIGNEDDTNIDDTENGSDDVEGEDGEGEYEITEDEVYEFFDTYIAACSNALGNELLSEDVLYIQENPECLQTIGCVYGISVALDTMHYEDCQYFFSGLEYVTSEGIISEEEKESILEKNPIYAGGCQCINGNYAQRFLNNLYGAGIVDVFEWDNYSEAFTSSNGYVITGTGIGDGPDYTYEITDIYCLYDGTADVYCDRYTSFMGDEPVADGQYIIKLYKNDDGVHFYSKNEIKEYGMID